MNNLSVIVIFAFFSFLFAQSGGKEVVWEKEYDENNIIVLTSYPEITLANGEMGTLVKWKLTATKKIDYQKCVKTIMNVKLHKKLFLHCEESKILSSTDSSYLVYYYYDNPWPAPNMDNIRTTIFKKDSVNKIFIYEQISTPDKYEKQDVERLKISNIKYRLEKLKNGYTKFYIEEMFLPQGAPMFLVKSFFPEGPVDFLERIIEISSESND